MSSSKREKIDALADEIAIAAANIDAATHSMLVKIREFDELKGWAAQGASSCSTWLSWRLGLGLGAAREQIRVARRLADLPRIDEALRRGELSYTKVRAMTRVATADNEELLMHQARGSTGAQLERICATFARLPDGVRSTDPERRYVRKRTHRDGTMTLEMRLLPDEVDELWLALRETQSHLAPTREEAPTLADAALYWARLEALALAKAAAAPSEADDVSAETSGDELFQRFERADDESPPNVEPAGSTSENTTGAPLFGAPRFAQPTLFLHLRPEHLGEKLPSNQPVNDVAVSGPERWRAELHDGTAISGDSLKRMACDCAIVGALVSDRGRPLALGRRRRTVSVGLMRALQLRDRGCRFPGCKHRAFVQAHHIRHWSDGGETNEENLVLLCSYHHGLTHEGGFSVEATDDEHGLGFAFRDPDGQLVSEEPPRPRACHDGAMLRHEVEGVEVRRPVPLWDGTPLDLEAAVNALANQDQFKGDPGSVFPTTCYPPQKGDVGT